MRPMNAILGWLLRGFNRAFDGLTTFYAWTIRLALRWSALVLLVYLGLVGLTCWAFTVVPTGFIPEMDQGRLIASLQLPDARGARAYQGCHGQGGQDHSRKPRRGPHDHQRRLRRRRQCVQLGVDVRHPETVRGAAEPRPAAPRRSSTSSRPPGISRSRRPRSPSTARRRSRASARPGVSSWSSKTVAGLA